MTNHLDAYLTTRAQEFADWLHHTLGFGCFSLARLLFAICTCIEVGLALHLLGSVLLAAVNLIVPLFIFFYCEEVIAKHGDRSRNPLEVTFAPFRILFLLCLPLQVGSCDFFSSVGHIVALYFYSCTPAPPANSRLKRWSQSFSARGRPQNV